MGQPNPYFKMYYFGFSFFEKKIDVLSNKATYYINYNTLNESHSFVNLVK